MKKMVAFHLLNTLNQALIEVFEKSKHADRMIDKYVRANPKWTPEDRKLFAEALYEITRHRKLFGYVAESDELLKIIGVYFLKIGFRLPPRNEFLKLSENSLSRFKDSKPTDIEYSIPDWLHELGEKQFKDRWPRLMKAMSEVPSVYIRANRIKLDTDKLPAELKKDSVQIEKFKSTELKLEEAFVVKDKKNIFNTNSYRSGFFEMQDAGSQFISTLLQLEPGLHVVDACAGSGGKSLHIASLLKNTGRVLAMDVQPVKLKDLNERALKAGVKIIETKLIESPKTIQNLEQKFDRVLLDAPCSGLGVLKRNPDSKWNLSWPEIQELIETQKKILNSYSEMAKPGAILVYATCSILNEENEEQVQSFLKSKNGQKWSLIKDYRLWPDLLPTDGFYAAVLKRNT
ncbi:MAG: RsmB/NOP family class I SAM-dependent RNA methyltransferase [Pseudobdellovibrio sp.]